MSAVLGLCPQTLDIHFRQISCAHVTTIKCTALPDRVSVRFIFACLFGWCHMPTLSNCLDYKILHKQIMRKSVISIFYGIIFRRPEFFQCPTPPQTQKATQPGIPQV